ncbi:MAG TPA: chemotaxis protein CheW [Gemmatimonadaceae bacterium]
MTGGGPGGGSNDREGRIAGADAALLFRVGRESFAAPLAEVEEAVDVTALHELPGATGALRGVVVVREALVPAYSAEAVLGARAEAPATALVIRRGDARLALLVDDVIDVIAIPRDGLQPAPGGGMAGDVVVGVAPHGARLVALLDVGALVAALGGGQSVEGQGDVKPQETA